MLRGVFEFVGSTLYIYTLKIALENEVNQGICSAMIMLAGLMLTIMSWVCYNEKLSCPQIFGMTFVLGSISLMGVFQTKGGAFGDGSVTEESVKPSPFLRITIFGALAALSLSSEAILIKWLKVRGVKGEHGA